MSSRKRVRPSITYAVAALRAAVALRVVAGAVAPQPGRSGQQPGPILTFSMLLWEGRCFLLKETKSIRILSKLTFFG